MFFMIKKYSQHLRLQIFINLLGFSFILLFLSFTNIAYAISSQMGPSYKLYKVGNLESQIHWETFYTNANYNDNVELKTLTPSGTFLRNYNMDLKFRLISNSNSGWKWGAQGTAINAQSPQVTKNRSALTALWFGIDHRFETSSVEFIVDGDFIISPYRVDVNQTDAVAGDGANILQGKLLVQKKWPSLIGYLYGGYVFRDSGMSDYVPVGLGLQWGIYDWILGSELKGALLSIEDDQYKAATSKRHVLLNKTNMGSFKYYSTNPEWFTGEVNLKFKLTDQFAFTGGVGTTLVGRNYSQGTFVYLGLDMQWPAFLETPKGKSAVQRGKEDEFVPQFEEEN